MVWFTIKFQQSVNILIRFQFSSYTYYIAFIKKFREFRSPVS